MNFKRFISGVSAFAVASSAFAGMAISANAADAAKSPVLQGDYTVSGAQMTPWVLTSSNPSFPASAEVTTDGITVKSGYSGSRTRNGYITNTFEQALEGDISIEMVIKFNNDVSAGGYPDRNPQIHILDDKSTDIIWFCEDGQNGAVYADGVKVAGNNTTQFRQSTWTLKVDINTASHTLSYSGTTDKSGSFSGQKTIADTAKLGGLYVRSGENVANKDSGVVSLQKYKVWKDDITETYNKYKVRYKDSDGAEIKDAVDRTGTTGKNVTLLASDKETFYSKDGTKKYVYKSDNASETTITGDDAAEVTVTFDTYTKATHDVKAYAGGTVISSTTVSGYSDETGSYGPLAYIKYEDKYYKYNNIKTDGSVDSIEVKYTDSNEIRLDYTEAPSVVFYAEAENATSGASFNYTGDSNIASGGHTAGCTKADSNIMFEFEVPVSGTYQMTANAVGIPGSGTRSFYAVLGDSEQIAVTSSGQAVIATTTPVHLEKGTNTAYLKGNGSNGAYTDYIVIELVEADAQPVTATLTNVESKSYSKAENYDSDVTAAKLHINVANGSAKVKVEYDGQSDTTSTSLMGEAIIGAIIKNRAVSVTKEDFTVTAVVE